MTNRTLTYDEKHTNKSWLNRFGRLVAPHAKTEKNEAVSAEELERLDMVRKLREENRIRKYSLPALSIEDFIARRW